MVFFIPWRVVAEESGAAHFGFGGAMLLDLPGPALRLLTQIAKSAALVACARSKISGWRCCCDRGVGEADRLARRRRGQRPRAAARQRSPPSIKPNRNRRRPPRSKARAGFGAAASRAGNGEKSG
jgi:hypothetical protein